MSTKNIKLEVSLPIALLHSMIDAAECKIVDKAKFNKLLTTKKFQKELAAELVNSFGIMNECDDDGMLLELVPSLFGSVVISEYDEECDEEYDY